MINALVEMSLKAQDDKLRLIINFYLRKLGSPVIHDKEVLAFVACGCRTKVLEQSLVRINLELRR